MSVLQIGLNGQLINVVSLPTSPERRAVQFDMSDAVSIVTSPFTGQTQAQQWPGADLLSGTMTLPFLTQDQADDWISFLMECRGMANAFMIGDPLQVSPRGSGSGTPFADNSQNNGNPAGSQFLGTKGWTANAVNVLRRGDWFSMNWRLYRCLADITADGSGKALIPIWPSLRELPSADGTFNTFQNATGTVELDAGHPLGNPAWYALWSNFNLAPGVALPPDAVIQGIYPVMVASNNSDAIPDNRYGVGLVPWFGGPGTSFLPPTPPYTNQEMYGASIGTTLAALSGQEMVISLGATLANPHTGSMSVSKLGYAIYYTSATPVIDPSIPPPFSVPSGQGLSWAMPFTAAFGPIETGDNNGSASASAAQANGAIGVMGPKGLFRLAKNSRSWSADVTRASSITFPIQEYR